MTSRTLVQRTETVTEKHSCDILDPNNNERLTSHRAANGQRRARKQRSHKRSLDTTKSVRTIVQPNELKQFQTWNQYTTGMFTPLDQCSVSGTYRNQPKWEVTGWTDSVNTTGCLEVRNVAPQHFGGRWHDRSVLFLSFSFTNTPKLEYTISWTITFVFVLGIHFCVTSTHSAL